MAQTAGALLGDLYFELQPAFAQAIVVPKLGLMKASEVRDLVQTSKDHIEATYASVIETETTVNKFVEYCLEKGKQISDDTAKQHLATREKELLEYLDGLLPDGCDDSSPMLDAIGAQNIVSWASRLFWPIVFYHPENENTCWTWPPELEFVRARLNAKELLRATNNYLPTLLRPDAAKSPEMSDAAKMTMRAVHSMDGFGNVQDIKTSEKTENLGVAAFDDRVMLDYHSVDRDHDAGYFYDLLVGAVSGVHCRVALDANDNASGLLVLCSAVKGLFHKLLFTEEVTDNVVLADSFPEGTLDQLRETFNATNGPRILSYVYSQYSYMHALQDEAAQYRKELLSISEREHQFVGESDAIQSVKATIDLVANKPIAVLIQGESGTGKEVVARAIHHASSRRANAFVAVNCSALSEQLLESELFGHEKGAFTGADSRRIGLFEQANGGTLFLDELGEMPIDLQKKCLRVLQENEFKRVGGTETLSTDVRIVAATNKDLHQAMIDGTFRNDLYYRLNDYPITLPPLRDRIEDVEPLATYFVDKYRDLINDDVESLSQDAQNKLRDHDWKGNNVRELEKVIKRSLVENLRVSGNVISADQIIFEKRQREFETDDENAVDELLTNPSLDVLDNQSASDQNGEWQKKQQALDRLLKSLGFDNIPTSRNERAAWYSANREAICEEIESAIQDPNQDFSLSDLFVKSDVDEYFKRSNQTNSKKLWNDNSSLRFHRSGPSRNAPKFVTYLEVDWWIEERNNSN